MIKKAILPVAGLGTRFLPASKSIPKEMVTVVDRPAIEYVVREAVAAGIEQIILVTHSSKASIENYFDRNFELETTLEQKNKTDLLSHYFFEERKMLLKCQLANFGNFIGSSWFFTHKFFFHFNITFTFQCVDMTGQVTICYLQVFLHLQKFHPAIYNQHRHDPQPNPALKILI